MAMDELQDSETMEDSAAAGDGDEVGKEDIKESLKKVIQVRVIDAGVLRKTLAISVPRESLQVELDKEFKELVSESTVPGFRKGRAPRRLIEKRFGRDVNDQVQTRIVSNAYLAAVDREKINVLGDPMVWVRMDDKAGESREQLVDMQTALVHLRVPDAGDFEFKCEVEVKPEFTLPELVGIPVEKPEIQISDADVQMEIDRIRARRGTLAPAGEDSSVVENDFLVCDMRVLVDGRETKKVENMPCAARPQMLEGAVISDFGTKMAGAKSGEVRTLAGTLPEDHEMAELRGKSATFEMKVLEIKRLQLPPLDTMFFESMGFENESDFRGAVRSNMESQLGSEIRRGMYAQVRQYLLDNTQIEIPEGLSSKQAERIAARRRVELARQGVPDDEISKHSDEMMTGARDQAVRELKLFFMLDAIAEQRKIEVGEDDLNAQIHAIARAYNRRFDRVRDELARNNGLTMLYLEVRDEKCIEELLKEARITELSPEAMKEKATEKAHAAVTRKATAAAPTESATTESKKGKAAKAGESAKSGESTPGKSAAKKPATKSAGEAATEKPAKPKKKAAETADEAPSASKTSKKAPRKKG